MEVRTCGGLERRTAGVAGELGSNGTIHCAAASEALHVGGQAVKAGLTRRDQEICDIIGPELSRLGMIFVGIDVIGDYLTEINVTSPTGLQQINRFDGVCLEAQIWDSIEARYTATRA